jgi:hypothetical protein
MGDLGGGFLEAFSEFDLGAHLAGEFGRNVKGLGFAFHQNGEEELGMEFLTLGATASRLAALAGPRDEGTGEHLAESPQAADQSAAEVESWISGHNCH